MNITFHAAHPEDPDAVLLIEELSATLAEITGDSGKNSFANADVDEPRAIFLLAKSGDAAIGCGALRRIDDSTCELKRMYVKTKRSGIGSRLLSQLEREARNLGYARIWLETRKVNTRAVSFYLKHGYVPISNFGKYVGNSAAVCFEKKLA